MDEERTHAEACRQALEEARELERGEQFQQALQSYQRAARLAPKGSSWERRVAEDTRTFKEKACEKLTHLAGKLEQRGKWRSAVHLWNAAFLYAEGNPENQRRIWRRQRGAVGGGVLAAARKHALGNEWRRALELLDQAVRVSGADDRELRLRAMQALQIEDDLDKAPMVFVPAGPFLMGSDSHSEAERPRRVAQTQSFYIDKYPVTNAQYQRFLDWVKKSNDHSFCHSAEPPDKDHTPSTWKTEENIPNHPVVGIDWYDAYAYASWVRKRLPTETEWERAARGVDGRTAPWGEGPACQQQVMQAYCRTKWHRPDHTVAVDHFKDNESPYGCSGMCGNVWEWCADAVGTGPTNATCRVIRGGSFASQAWDMRCSLRLGYRENLRFRDVGFRCVKPV